MSTDVDKLNIIGTERADRSVYLYLLYLSTDVDKYRRYGFFVVMSQYQMLLKHYNTLRYGVSFDESTGVGTRLYNAAGKQFSPAVYNNNTVGVDEFKNINPFDYKNCITLYDSATDTRSVVAYYGNSDFDYYYANKIGDVMIEFPKFWYRRPNKLTWIVSPKYIPGYLPSPMHYRDGVMYDYAYISKYILDSNLNSVHRENKDVWVKGLSSTAKSTLLAKKQYVLDYTAYCCICILAFIKYNTMDISSILRYGIGSMENSGCLAADLNDGYHWGTSGGLFGEYNQMLGLECFYSNYLLYLDGAFHYGSSTDIYYSTSLNNRNIPTTSNINSYRKINSKIPICTSSTNHEVITNIMYDLDYPELVFPTACSYNGDITQQSTYNNSIYKGFYINSASSNGSSSSLYCPLISSSGYRYGANLLSLDFQNLFNDDPSSHNDNRFAIRSFEVH